MGDCHNQGWMNKLENNPKISADDNELLLQPTTKKIKLDPFLKDYDPEDKIHTFKNEIKQEIKAEPFDEVEARDISKICFDHEDKIPVKKEIKQEIKYEPLDEVEDVHKDSNDDVAKRASDISNIRFDHEDKILPIKIHVKTVQNEMSKDKNNGHESRKHFDCQKCGKSFTRKDHLKRHNLNIHEGIKDHQCQICSMKFGRSGHLKRHVKRVHVHDGADQSQSLKCKKKVDTTHKIRSKLLNKSLQASDPLLNISDNKITETSNNVEIKENQHEINGIVFMGGIIEIKTKTEDDPLDIGPISQDSQITGIEISDNSEEEEQEQDVSQILNQCGICDKKLDNLLELNNHMKSEHSMGRQKIEVKQSQKIKNTNVSQTKDEYNPSSSRIKVHNYKCQECNSRWKSKEDLEKHTILSHSSNPSSKEPNKMKTYMRNPQKARSISKDLMTTSSAQFQCQTCRLTSAKKYHLNQQNQHVNFCHHNLAFLNDKWQVKTCNN